MRCLRATVACCALLLALGAPGPRAAADEAAAPPGLDAWSGRVLRGLIRGTAPRGAAIAPDGTVHVVYGDSELRHAWREGDAWSVETLDPSHRGEEAALAIDVIGRLHVAYADSVRGTFAAQLITTGEIGVPLRTAITADEDGAAHIAWVDSISHRVGFTSNVLGEFVVQNVATDAGTESDVDVALDDSGAPHVAFMSAAPPTPPTPGRGVHAMVHATRGAAGWTREVVEADNDNAADGVGAGGSLAIDASGTLHVVYLGKTDVLYSPRPLRHARATAGGYEIESIGPAEPLLSGRTRTLATPDGELHVAASRWLGGQYVHGTWGSWSGVALPGGRSATAFAIAIDGDGDSVHAVRADNDGVLAGISIDGADFQTSQIDANVTVVSSAAVAADAQGSPRIALLRRDAQGTHIEAVRRDGSAWRVERVDDDASSAHRPSIVLDAAGRASIAYLAPDGSIRVADDGGGAGTDWTSEVAVAGSGAAPLAFALALAPDGTRRVLFLADGATILAIATEEEGGWSAADVASPDVAQIRGSPCDIAVSADGEVHVAWFGFMAELHHARFAGGEWEVSNLGQFLYEWGGPTTADVVVDPAGAVWIAFHGSWQFGAVTVAVTNRNGTWETLGLSSGAEPALGFTPSGVGRAIGGGYGISRGIEAEPYWQGNTIDLGPASARAFGGWDPAVTEGDGAVAVGVRTARSGQWTTAQFGGAVDPVGGVHGVYVDTQTSDLRYVTDRDPGRAAVSSLDVVVTGGTAAADDFSQSHSRVAFADDDSGTKFVTFTAPLDGVDEPEEAIELALASPLGGVAIGSPGTTRVRVIDADPSPPVPEPEPVPDGAYFLPTTVRQLGDGAMDASGVLHLGRAAFDPALASTLTIAGRSFDLPPMEPRRVGTWTTSGDGARLRLRTRRESVAIDFDVDLPPGPPAEGDTVTFALTHAALDARSVVRLDRGRLDLARGVGGFHEPEMHLERLSGVVGSRIGLPYPGGAHPGRITFRAYLADLGPRPNSAPDLRVSPWAGVEMFLPGEALRRDRNGWRSRVADAVIDYRRGVVEFDLRRADVEWIAEDRVPASVTVSVEVGAVRRSLVTVMRVDDSRFRW